MSETHLQGRHEGGLFVEKSGVFVGDDGAVVDAGGRGAALHVTNEESDVVLRGLTFTGGRSELGGGVRVDAWVHVTLEDCVIEGNARREGGAAGAGVRAGEVHFVRVRFGPTDDVLVKGGAEVEFDDCEIAGDVRVQGGATVRFVGGAVRGRLIVTGEPSEAPTVVIDGAAIATIENDDEFPGTISGA